MPAAILEPAVLRRKNPSRIAGKHWDYVVKRLVDFRDVRRTNGADVMRRIAPSLTETDIDDRGNYLLPVQG